MFYYAFDFGNRTEENLRLMRIMDEMHMKHPTFGRRMMTDWLKLQGHEVNVKRVRRLMELMGLHAIYQRPRTTIPAKGHTIYPYLIRDVAIVRRNQVWSTDITYIPMERGFMYLVAVMDWYSRHVLSWQVSNTLEGSFCIDALTDALEAGYGKPEIFNTDQGSQFTSHAFTKILLEKEIQISMDGKGRALDNVFIERLWRTVKYEDIYLKGYDTVADLITGLTAYFRFYSLERPHKSLNGRTPWEFYNAAA
jgi:putative transposase